MSDLRMHTLDPAAVGWFQQAVLAWYHAYGRKTLPWQVVCTPYRVWVSEIMLQQTQVATVTPFFERFVDRFPDVQTLAESDLDQVLALWAGLGYYARARNLHRAARTVAERFDGEPPDDLAALTALPGIGRSTAGAIISLGHGRQAAILDGNVKRVFCRYHGVEGWPGSAPVNRRLWSLSEQLTPSTHTRRYNQAMMDLGAMVCTARRPACAECPLTAHCHARRTASTTSLPSPRPKRLIAVRQGFLLLLRSDRGDFYLEKRPPGGIWGGLWCLPLFERRHEVDDWTRQRSITPTSIEPLPIRRHTFSHFHLDYIPLVARTHTVPLRITESGHELWHPANSRCEAGLPAPIRRLLDELGYFDESE